MGLFRFLKPAAEGIGCIIFSKDRPLQLASLLDSMAYYAPDVCNVHVLYNVSNEAFGSAYRRLGETFPKIVFHKENSFRTDLIRLLNDIDTSLVFFLVDDIIFTDKFELSPLLNRLAQKSVISLRLHPNVTYSYMTSQNQTPPVFLHDHGDLLEFSWRQKSIDWAYPLSVDGHIFRKHLITKLIKKSTFKAPNSLEASLQRFTRTLTRQYTGMCYKTPKIINFPVNKVQTEFENNAGNESPEDFLRLFEAGYEIDFKHYEKSAFNSVHVDTKLVLTRS